MKNLVVLLVSLLITACANRKAEIENAMKQYDRLTFRMAGDSLADTYTPDGELGGKGMKTYIGRDSIRKFLKSFDPASIKLISNSTKVVSIDYKGDTAVVEGAYEQKAKLPQGDTGIYIGTFTAKWMKGEGGKWLIRKMYTVPTKLTTLKSVLLRQLKTTHTEKDWFVPANIAVEGLTAKQAMWKDGSGNHSAGQLATHLIFWNERLLKSFRNEAKEKFSGNNDETFNSFDEKSWDETVKKLDEVLSSWEKEIKNADETKLKDWYESIANMNTHNAYHTGQIIFLRKLQGSWNPEKGVK
jgi:ketosteroid isomerase-like protein